MVNNRYKSLFIHVPKTGGTSMEQVYFVKNDIKLGYTHHTIKMMVKCGFQMDNYFKWAFVRHPLDRLVSAYVWAVKENQQKYFRDINSFSDFISKIETFYDFNNIDYESDAQLRRGIHVIPQYVFLHGVELDFIGRFENIQTDWNIICKKLSDLNGEELYQKLPHRLKSGSNNIKKYYEYYTDEEKKKIYSLYKKDFELFGYTL